MNAAKNVVQKKKIGILGGTFNPIHNAHLLIAEYAWEQFGLDKIWFMTSGNPPHKRDEIIVDKYIRQEMTSLAIENNPHFELFSYEVDKDEYSYTANTLSELRHLYLDTEFYFIIGADSLEMFSTWYEPQTIASSCTLLVFSRKGTEGLDALVKKRKDEYNADIRVIDAPILELSSTEIRSRLRSGKSVRYMSPDNVLQYIYDKKIY